MRKISLQQETIIKPTHFLDYEGNWEYIHGNPDWSDGQIAADKIAIKNIVIITPEYAFIQRDNTNLGILYKGEFK